MRTICVQHIGENAQELSAPFALFANNIDKHLLDELLSPVLSKIGKRMAETYKSPVTISFTGCSAFLQKALAAFMQFDDICIKLLHVPSGRSAYVTMSTRLARTLLIRLLATSLIDDSHGLLFSSTEKGIFSFVTAKILFDLKNALRERMPDFKLIGTYHREDDAVVEADMNGCGVINLSLSFGSDIYPISLLLPDELIKTLPKRSVDKSRMLPRSGHMTRHCHFFLKTLSLSRTAFLRISRGDLIVFDNFIHSRENETITGPLFGCWENITIAGNIVVNDGRYFFCMNVNQEHHMEEVEITLDAESENREEPTTLHNVAKNIRVALGIELSRLPLTLEALCELKPGQILDLHRKIDDPLDMVVEGKIIGRCQPVKIDERLGIRVLSIDGDENLDA